MQMRHPVDTSGKSLPVKSSLSAAHKHQKINVSKSHVTKSYMTTYDIWLSLWHERFCHWQTLTCDLSVLDFGNAKCKISLGSGNWWLSLLLWSSQKSTHSTKLISLRQQKKITYPMAHVRILITNLPCPIRFGLKTYQHQMPSRLKAPCQWDSRSIGDWIAE